MGKIEHIILLIISFLIKSISKDKLLILNYHSLLNTNSPRFFSSDINKTEFECYMHLISRYLNPVRLSEGVIKLKKKGLKSGAVAVTFDDGYKDNVTLAFPILIKYNLTATFYIATGFLNGGIMWNDVIIESIKRTKKNKIDLSHLDLGVFELNSKTSKIYAIEQILKTVKYKSLMDRKKLIHEINQICDVTLPDDLMMNDEDVICLYQNGMEIGGHTSNHPILTSENDKVVSDEIHEGKQYLENLLNTKLTAFAYPNGKLDKDYKPKHAKLLKKAGFSCAVTTNWGINKKNTDHFQLYRFTPWDKTPIMFMLRLLKLTLFSKV